MRVSQKKAAVDSLLNRTGGGAFARHVEGGDVMPKLQIGTRSFDADRRRVVLEAERMFRLSEAQRRHRVETAKTRLARAFDAGEAHDDVARHTAIILLSQGITEI
jgi:hypothetical protein